MNQHESAEASRAESLTPSDGFPTTPLYAEMVSRGYVCVTLPEGARRHVNVLPALLKGAVEEKDFPTVVVRPDSDLYAVGCANAVEYFGNVTTTHRPDRPLPCTGVSPSAGAAYNSTEGALRCYVAPKYLQVAREGEPPEALLPHQDRLLEANRVARSYYLST